MTGSQRANTFLVGCLVIPILGGAAFRYLNPPTAEEQDLRRRFREADEFAAKQKEKARREQEEREAAARWRRIDQEQALRMKVASWWISGFGVIAMANVQITNDNAVSIKDLIIDCRVYAKSKTDLGVVGTTLFERVPPKSARTYRDVNLGRIHPQAGSISCRIEGFTPIE